MLPNPYHLAGEIKSNDGVIDCGVVADFGIHWIQSDGRHFAEYDSWLQRF